MARARNIKPNFFKNELLGVADPMINLLFISLWTLADKSGRLEDRPLRIKAETFPYRENIDVNGYLTELQRLEFICRYYVDGVGYIQVLNFEKHQAPHKTEKESVIPSMEKMTTKTESCALTVKQPLSDGEITAALPPDSLIPDSLIPDSLIPDCLNDEPTKNKPCTAVVTADAPKKKKEASPEIKAIRSETWTEYSKAFFNKYGTEPVRNAKVNSAVCRIVDSLGDESPLVAAFYLSHNGAWYTQHSHAIEYLAKDAESLRTQWATNRVVTGRKAQEVERLGAGVSSMFDGIDMNQQWGAG